jgi:hypothetical protein
MPILVGLGLVIQLGFAIHAMKSGRHWYWIIIVMTIPVLGPAAYFLFELLPELRNSRTGRKAAAEIARTIDPERGYRERFDALQINDSVENRRQLAEECMELGRYGEAAVLFERSLEGPHKQDPAILFGLARARFGLEDWQDVIDTLDRLREHNSEFQSQDAHMLYARSLENLGRVDEARKEMEALASYYAGPEAKARHGLMLQKTGEPAKARTQFEEIERLYGKRRMQLEPEDRQWLDVARANL